MGVRARSWVREGVSDASAEFELGQRLGRGLGLGVRGLGSRARASEGGGDGAGGAQYRPGRASQAPSELASSARGVVYIGHRGAYHVAGAGQDGHAMYRDADNRFWSNRLTYYGTSNGYWIASVNGIPDTYLAFQTTAVNSDAPFFKVLIHTPNTTGYAAWDEATRGNAQ